MTLMQVRFAHDRAKLMTELLERAAATEPTAEGRQFAAEMAALFTYRRVRLWGPAEGAEATPKGAQGATAPMGVVIGNDGPDPADTTVRRPVRRKGRVSVPAAAAKSTDSATARAS